MSDRQSDERYRRDLMVIDDPGYGFGSSRKSDIGCGSLPVT